MRGAGDDRKAMRGVGELANCHGGVGDSGLQCLNRQTWELDARLGLMEMEMRTSIDRRRQNLNTRESTRRVPRHTECYLLHPACRPYSGTNCMADAFRKSESRRNPTPLVLFLLH